MVGKGNYCTPTCQKLVSICFGEVCEIDAWVCPVSFGFMFLECALYRCELDINT